MPIELLEGFERNFDAVDLNNSPLPLSNGLEMFSSETEAVEIAPSHRF